MDSLNDPAPLDPELAGETHRAEERERAAFVLFMLLAIGLLLGFLLWRTLFGGPDWKPASETWTEIGEVAVPVPDPWAVAEKETVRQESGDEIRELAFQFKKGLLLDPLAQRWERFLEEQGFETKTEVSGNGETRRVKVRGEKAGRAVELDLRTWDRRGRLTSIQSGD